jgi:DNA-binding transcriptional LysR family regulator
MSFRHGADFMRNKNIETFYWVAKIGNFHAAAQRLNTTQPTVSARVRALETELGFDLFDRVGSVARLNNEGRHFVQYAEQFISISDEVERSFRGKANIRRTVRIGVNDTVAGSWFMDFLHAANETFPDVTFEMSCDMSPQIQAQILSYELDIGFIVGPTGHPLLKERPICSYPWTWVASPDLKLPARRLTLHDLAQHTIVTFPRVSEPYLKIGAELRKVTKHPRIHCASSTHAMMTMAKRGWCLTVLPSVIVADVVRRKELQPIQTCIEFDDNQYVASFMATPVVGLYNDLADIAITTAGRETEVVAAGGARSKKPIIPDQKRKLDGRRTAR